MTVWAALGDINAEDNLFVKKTPSSGKLTKHIILCDQILRLAIKLKRELYSLSFFIFFIIYFIFH